MEGDGRLAGDGRLTEEPGSPVVEAFSGNRGLGGISVVISAEGSYCGLPSSGSTPAGMETFSATAVDGANVSTNESSRLALKGVNLLKYWRFLRVSLPEPSISPHIGEIGVPQQWFLYAPIS